MNMKSGGYTYQIHDRTGNIARISGVNIYKSISWEVWNIRQTKKDRIEFGKLVPAGSDRMPSPGDWGRHGWPCKDEEIARSFYREKIIQECA